MFKTIVITFYMLQDHTHLRPTYKKRNKHPQNENNSVRVAHKGAV